MIRLEQVRAEMIERFERIDRRLAQQDQRMGRLDQREGEAADRVEALRLEILTRLDALAAAVRRLASGDAGQAAFDSDEIAEETVAPAWGAEE